MFDNPITNRNDPGGQQGPPGDHIDRPKVPLFTLLAWAAIIVASVFLMLAKQHTNASVAPITQADFLGKLDSNQIARATVQVNQQTMPLVEITGTYYEVGTDGKVSSTEIPFTVHNFLLSGEVENKLVHSPRIAMSSPNTALANLLWGVAPFLILGVLFWFFLIRRIKAKR